MMRDKLTDILSSLSWIPTILMVLIMGYVEVGGIYHSFVHCGPLHGFVSVFAPPYAWYRSITLPFWLKERKDIRSYYISILKLKEEMDSKKLHYIRFSFS